MRLYFLERKDEADYNEYDKMIIRAKSAKQARMTASHNGGDEPPATWIDKDLSTCKVLKPDGEVEFILGNYIGD